MDNLTHTLAGAVLARAGMGKLSSRATAALVIASNLPDADSVVAFKGSLFYLEHHRGITHSILGIIALALALAGALSISFRRGADREKPRFAVLFLISLLALALHVFMDFLNSYGVRPFLPWNGTWFYGDLAFILDPWMWLILGGALYLSGRRLLPYALLAVVTSAILVRGSLDEDIAVPGGAVGLWFAALLLLVPLRSRIRNWPTGANRVALAGLSCYVLCLGVAHAFYLGELRRESRQGTSGAISVLAALPTATHPGRWVGVVDTGDALSIFRDGVWTHLRRGLADPAVEAIRTSCAGATLFRFYRFPVAEVAREGPNRTVILRDARYRLTGRSGFGAATLTVGPDLTPGPSLPCPKPAAWAQKRLAFFSCCLGPPPNIECAPSFWP